MTIQEILDRHKVSAFAGADTACACDRMWRTNTEYRAHVAEVLDKHMQEREAAIIAGLAELLDEYRSNHDIAECAAPVEGETGRQAVIDNWESIIEEPADWLREQSKLHHERGFDYLQQARYEAWYEGWAEFDADAENPYADEEPTDGR